MALMGTMEHDDGWKNKAAKAPFQRKSNYNPNSKTDQSRAALFEVVCSPEASLVQAASQNPYPQMALED